MRSHTSTISRKKRRSLTLCNVGRKVEFRSIFCAPSQNFKILAIPNVLTLVKSYEHSFTKKYDNHKYCAKSSFDRFFMHRFRI
ncbi:hypothetical protein BHE74_00025795 [Ensete ventricosum]|nr:hypothetical protein GW17_00050621 [Ensete ventricosum]RWW66817.1 hypothetical protein BHE74_00025795 [Ensete ventricosum]RZR96060.1 hypothetical protein BHM03_00025003 [Ensete ventricosum]